MLAKVLSKIAQMGQAVQKTWKASKGYSLGRKLAVSINVIQLQLAYARKQRFVVRRVHKGIMKLNIHRPGVGYELAIWGDREELDTYVVKHSVLPGMTIIDIGANIGYYTLLTASLVGPSGRVFAHEPFPPNYEDLSRNVAINKLQERVKTYPIAVADKEGEATFFLGESDNLGSLEKLREARNPDAKTIKVKTTTIDTIAKTAGQVDFLRMDIEGAECQVFDGMSETFRQTIPPRILFEVHPSGNVDPDPRFTTYFERLVALGYRPRFMISSANPLALKRFAGYGYEPAKASRDGQHLFENVSPNHLIDLGARRPKVTRSIYLQHSNDHRSAA